MKVNIKIGKLASITIESEDESLLGQISITTDRGEIAIPAEKGSESRAMVKQVNRFADIEDKEVLATLERVENMAIAACAFYNVKSVDQLKDRKKKEKLANARYAAYQLCKEASIDIRYAMIRFGRDIRGAPEAKMGLKHKAKEPDFMDNMVNIRNLYLEKTTFDDQGKGD